MYSKAHQRSQTTPLAAVIRVFHAVIQEFAEVEYLWQWRDSTEQMSTMVFQPHIAAGMPIPHPHATAAAGT
jgi:hypothetical protein